MENLPLEIIIMIMNKLSYRATTNMSKTCKTLNIANRDNLLWYNHLRALVHELNIETTAEYGTENYHQLFTTLKTGFITVCYNSKRNEWDCTLECTKRVTGGDVAMAIGPFESPERGIFATWLFVNKRTELLEHMKRDNIIMDESMLDAYLTAIENFDFKYEWGHNRCGRVIRSTERCARILAEDHKERRMESSIANFIDLAGVRYLLCKIPRQTTSTHKTQGHGKRKVSEPSLLIDTAQSCKRIRTHG